MKNNYQRPDMRVVRIRHQALICNSETRRMGDIDTGDTGFTYKGIGSGPSRIRQKSVWSEWDEWE